MNADSYHKPVMRDGSKDLRTLLERYLVRSGHAATVVARKVVIRRLMVDIYNLWEGVWFGAQDQQPVACGRGKGGGTPRNNIFFNFLVMNLFNKFSMLKKPYLSYIFKLVAGDNCVFI